MPAVKCNPKIIVRVHRCGKCIQLQSVSIAYINIDTEELVLSALYIGIISVQSKSNKFNMLYNSKSGNKNLYSHSGFNTKQKEMASHEAVIHRRYMCRVSWLISDIRLLPHTRDVL